MALVIALLALPVAAIIAALVCLPIAWPRAAHGPARRALAMVTALGAAHLAQWLFVTAVGLRSLGLDRAEFATIGAALATIGLVATVAIAIARLRGSAARRALAWVVPHALFLAAYLTRVGRAGVGEML